MQQLQSEVTSVCTQKRSLRAPITLGKWTLISGQNNKARPGAQHPTFNEERKIRVIV